MEAFSRIGGAAVRESDRDRQAWFGGRARLVALAARTDARGTLQPLDFDALPFAPRRLFFVHDVPAGAVRGEHAHRTARQLLFRLAGTIDVELRTADDGARVVLDRSDRGLLLEPGVWAAQTYRGADAGLLVLADEPFDPASYVAHPFD